MRIIHLIARLNDGGPARVIRDLAAASLQAGDQVEVWHGQTAADEVDLAQQLSAQGITLRLLPELGRSVRLRGDWATLRLLIREWRAAPPDVVHTHTAKAGALGRIACRWLGLTCLHSYHGHVLHGYFRPSVNTALRWCERALSSRCALHSLTPSLVRELAGRHHLGRPSRWHALPVPVQPVPRYPADWHRCLPTGPGPVIGFLGRCAAVKDLTLWIDTLAEIHQHQPVRGLVCGDGPERAAAQARAVQLGLPVHFTGTVRPGEALGAMDLLLMSSRNEGLPLVAVEAAGARVPVVAPLVGGLRDLALDGVVTGAKREATALAAACERVLLQRRTPLGERRAERARQQAAQLAPAIVTPRYLALYRSLAANR